ncbi:MAG: hypothetical protein ACJAS9_003397 [Polaribacter sp.]|jgi:hypothetical protein
MAYAVSNIKPFDLLRMTKENIISVKPPIKAPIMKLAPNNIQDIPDNINIAPKTQ